MNRRDQIRLTPAEQRQYLQEMRTITLASHGPDGYPHAIAMWFVADEDGTVWMTTYRKSQKAVNIRRDPHVALSAESGASYNTLKGILIRGDAAVIDDPEVVFGVLRRVHTKMMGAIPEGVDDAMRVQAVKRVAIKVTPRRISSWDHAKLAGVY
jgi:PPOX class probable F420-dependent enzyme